MMDSRPIQNGESEVEDREADGATQAQTKAALPWMGVDTSCSSWKSTIPILRNLGHH